ncbi:alpha/beta hydrolase [Sphaerisporangium krabiense]|uniref:Pimeloyl-ACP methyl ester carboxylesterase n=1 Tax=Sphaerisporangium krabiense TaxID=763782 RepID=A0A7W9DQM8_9ACTN|nr:alpha/beta fold hydrolase [Sphaerisporangium krabiense]MBB5627563.1 pimeloyl-ACP methyl ester carboxylesterase [Sphaerisporangium krabiense]GII66578.1 alpha/beta hydrolase [Sphaerisporangium krabiense]
MEDPIPHWPGELVDLGGMAVHVRSAEPRPGAAPAETAVFVHGLAGSSTNWTDLMGELRDDVRGHAIDLPGAGYSPAHPDGDYSIAGHAAAVTSLVEHLGGPVHLLGNSLGGAVSVRVAATRPDLVRTLTLISPALPDLMPRYGPARVVLSATPGLGQWAMTCLRGLSAERRIRATMAMCYADSGRVHPARLEDAVVEQRRRDALPWAGSALIYSARALVNEYFRRGEDNLWRLAARVTAPTLVVHGRHDRLVDPRMAARAGRTFPDVRLVLIPDAGHVAQMEYPTLVARHVRHLLRTGNPDGSGRSGETADSGMVRDRVRL